MNARSNIIADVGRKVDWLLAHGQLPHPKLIIRINNHHVTDFLHVLFEHLGPKVGLGMIYDNIKDAYNDLWIASGIRVAVEVEPMLEQSGGYLRIHHRSVASCEYFIEPPTPLKPLAEQAVT